MKPTISIREFKTHCCRLLDQSQKEHKSFTITKNGKAIVQITPLNDNSKKASFFGAMQDVASINRDIMKPIESDWEAEQ